MSPYRRLVAAPDLQDGQGTTTVTSMVDDYEPKVEYGPTGGVHGKRVVMVRRLLASIFLTTFPVVVIPIALTSIGARAGAAPPTAVQQCKDGGWQTLTDASGQSFKNQGQCINYLIHNPVSLADLAGSFSGTTSVGGGTVVCSYRAALRRHVSWKPRRGIGDASPGRCFNPLGFPFTYTGIFAIATSVGTLAGNANGAVSSPPFPSLGSRLRADAYRSLRNRGLRRDHRHDPCVHTVAATLRTSGDRVGQRPIGEPLSTG